MGCGNPVKDIGKQIERSFNDVVDFVEAGVEGYKDFLQDSRDVLQDLTGQTAAEEALRQQEAALADEKRRRAQSLRDQAFERHVSDLNASRTALAARNSAAARGNSGGGGASGGVDLLGTEERDFLGL